MRFGDCKNDFRFVLTLFKGWKADLNVFNGYEMT